MIRLALTVCLLLITKIAFADGPVTAPTKRLDIEFPAISEMSGVAKSRTYDDVYWIHNDSGDTARLFAVNGQGRVIIPKFLQGDFYGEVPVAGEKPWPGISILNADNVDWEDIAIDGDTLYIADMGNNGNARRDLGVYVVAEPNPYQTERTRALKFIPIRYPDQSQYPAKVWHFDSEALFVWRHQLYFLTKHRKPGKIAEWEKGTKLYRLDSMDTDKVNVLKEVDSNDDLFIVTAADLSPDQKHLAVLCYTGLWIFDKPKHGDEWLSGTAHMMPLALSQTKQAEAVTFTDNDTILLGNEEGEWYTVKVDDVPPYLPPQSDK
ncbi:MAG: hypothetical protein KDI19_10645 [Pseudomonadales bacterium]|nr:hypothetical protein [Pseudomonadales bacterium]